MSKVLGNAKAFIVHLLCVWPRLGFRDMKQAFIFPLGPQSPGMKAGLHVLCRDPWEVAPALAWAATLLSSPESRCLFPPAEGCLELWLHWQPLRVVALGERASGSPEWAEGPPAANPGSEHEVMSEFSAVPSR